MRVLPISRPGMLSLLLAGGLGVAAAPGHAPQAAPAAPAVRLDQVPLSFVENRGQVDGPARYVVSGRDKTVYFSPSEITFRLQGPGIQVSRYSGIQAAVPEHLNTRIPPPAARVPGLNTYVLKLAFPGADPDCRPVGEAVTGGVVSYFTGDAPGQTGIPTFGRLRYAGLWPGVDLEYAGAEGRLKYQFTVAPGADPSQVRLAYRGAESVSVTPEGALEVRTPAGDFQDAPPVAYQEIGGKRVPVSCSYRLSRASAREWENGGMGEWERPFSHSPIPPLVSFEVGSYDKTKPLVIDPAVVVYCGFIAGEGEDVGKGIAVDAHGNAYVTGYTRSNQGSFPVKVGPELRSDFRLDAFVAKVRADGRGLIYCGYLGGNSDDIGNAVAVDAQGNAYVCGSTNSFDPRLSLRAGPDLSYNGGLDAFVAKVNPKGTGLVYCGYIGGSGDDVANGIALDGDGNAYVAGTTASTETTFPVKVGPDLTANTGNDAFVARVSADGSTLDFCGYVGGSGDDRGNAVAVDRSGGVYVAGQTASTEATFPARVGPDLTFNGSTTTDVGDAWVAKVAAGGASLDYCGYLGGPFHDAAYGIAVDGDGNAFLCGETNSSDAFLPVTVGPDRSYNGRMDAFVAKVKADGTGLVYCGYIGGKNDDSAYGIALDGGGNAYVTGITDSGQRSFPHGAGPDATYNGGFSDAFVARVKASGQGLAHCGYVGGRNFDEGRAIAVDGRGNAYITGRTMSLENFFPVRRGPGRLAGGLMDAFVAKIGR